MSKEENKPIVAENGVSEVNEQELENVSGGNDPSGHQTGSFGTTPSGHQTGSFGTTPTSNGTHSSVGSAVSDVTSAFRGLAQDLNLHPGQTERFNPHGR